MPWWLDYCDLAESGYRTLPMVILVREEDSHHTPGKGAEWILVFRMVER